MSVLSQAHFHEEAAAFAHLERLLWPEGPVCPHCGSVSGKHYDLRKTRLGLRKCSDCRKQFTVKVGTVFSPLTSRCISACRRFTCFAPPKRALARIS